MPNELKIGRVYRHFKGDFYLVEAVANDSETGEPFVVYRKLYGRNIALNCRRSPAPPATDAVKRIHFYFGFTETFSDFLYCKSLHKAL